MKSLIIFLIILFSFPLTAGCAITNEFGPYLGKVIDAETKDPIEGAAVLVVFYTEEYGPAGAITRYADALETITDKNGEFKFSAHRVTVFRPLQGWVKYGYFTIFKPEYGCYPENYEFIIWALPEGLGFSQKLSETLKKSVEDKRRRKFEKFIKTLPKERRERTQFNEKVDHHLPLLPMRDAKERLRQLNIPYFKLPDDINLEDIKWIDMYEEHINLLKLMEKSEYKVIGLPRLRTREERIESTRCSPQSYVPYSKAKKFIDLINEENESLGLGVEQYK